MDTQVMEWFLSVGLGTAFVGVLVSIGCLVGALLTAAARGPF
jgi:hypothetical protein